MLNVAKYELSKNIDEKIEITMK